MQFTMWKSGFLKNVFATNVDISVLERHDNERLFLLITVDK